MADAVTSQTLFDSGNVAVMLFTNLSDGTGESAVLKVDVSALNVGADGKTCTGVQIEKIIYDVSGMAVKILWDATTDVTAYILGNGVSSAGVIEFPVSIKNNSGTGKTGDIMFTTSGHTSGDSYSVYLYLRKSF